MCPRVEWKPGAMSERDRGSEPLDDDPGGEETAGEQPSADFPIPPTASRPIAPYDPYRSPGDAPRVSRRNVAAEGYASPRPSRGSDRGPFLPDDDPLNAEAWQLELGDIGEADENLDLLQPEIARDEPPEPRRVRRHPPSVRSRREAGPVPGRSPRRSRTVATTRERSAVTLTVPRAVSGASLVSDQTMLVLLGVNVVSIVIMALLLGMRLGGLPATIPLRIDAFGNPALWGPPSMLWRLPLMSLFITGAFLVVAWFVHPIDRFAARFALAAAIVAQAIAWIAVFMYLA
jgi:hypothetical protein